MIAKKPIPPEPFDEDFYVAALEVRAPPIAQALLQADQAQAKPPLNLPPGAVDLTADLLGRTISLIGVPRPQAEVRYLFPIYPEVARVAKPISL